MTFHEKLMYLRGLSAAYFTVEDLSLLLMPTRNLYAHEYEEYVSKIEKIYDKGVKLPFWEICIDSQLKSIEKFHGKIQEAE